MLIEKNAPYTHQTVITLFNLYFIVLPSILVYQEDMYQKHPLFCNSEHFVTPSGSLLPCHSTCRSTRIIRSFFSLSKLQTKQPVAMMTDGPYQVMLKDQKKVKQHSKDRESVFN